MSYIYPILTKSGTNFRVYFTHDKIKIYLGIFTTEEFANEALLEANKVMSDIGLLPDLEYISSLTHLSYKKVVLLSNYRDNHTIIKNPIYILGTHFRYYISEKIFLLFDIKDLFFLSTYKLYKRGNYIYTQDSISQQNILSRFGIQNHSVAGKDYIFKNNDIYDFRRENIEIINSYKGVSKKVHPKGILYVATIFTDKNIVLGHYGSEIEAAIAYNKGVDLLLSSGYTKDFSTNELRFITKTEYTQIYDSIRISETLLNPDNTHKRVTSNKKYRGISKDRSSFKAMIGYQNKQIYLGNYPTEKRAAQAYNYASLYLYGRKGHINPTVPIVHDPDTPAIGKKLLSSLPPKQSL